MRRIHSRRQPGNAGLRILDERYCGNPAALAQTLNSNGLHAWSECIRRCARLPSLDFLRGFEAAGRRLSFTLAAEELFLTQSALSRQIKALEDALGVALFERRHRALALTAAGVAFHREVTDVLQTLADRSRARARAGRVRPG